MAIQNYPNPNDPDFRRHQLAIDEAEKRAPTFLQRAAGDRAGHYDIGGVGYQPQTAFLYDPNLGRLSDDLNAALSELNDLKDQIDKLTNKPAVIPTKIFGLPSEEYELKLPIDVILEIYPDEALAVIPELELYGEGKNEMEALKDLKLELIDLYENFVKMSDEELGDSPREWKRILKSLVHKCQ